MSDLRKHLEAAKQEYQSLRYPGNLADEVLKGAGRNRVGVLIRLGAAAAIAALVVIAVRFRMNIPSSTQDQIAMVNPQSEEDDVYSDTTADEESDTEVASFGELPAMSLPQGVGSGLDLAPSAPDFSFSTPSFTLISDEQNSQTTSTTRESV